MQNMEWTQAAIELLPQMLEDAMNALVAAGINEFAVEDPQELEEFLDNTVYYDYVEDSVLEMREKRARIIVYLPQNMQGKEMLETVKDVVRRLKKQDDAAQLILSDINEQDWANNWKKYFKPISIGNKMLIKPSWETLPADCDQRIVLEIDPSSSFGTGTHATTQLCIELLENTADHAEILDMGCGSGILGVAAMLLGATCVTAVDIEEDAMRVARENAERNGIADSRFILYHGNVLEDQSLLSCIGQRKYDVILANIVADVIMAMTPLFQKLLKPEGILIASGIISDRKEEVLETIKAAGFDVLLIKEKEDWVAVQAVLRQE